MTYPEQGTPQGGVRTPPTILQTFLFGIRITRLLSDAEDHLDWIMVDFHPLDQRPEQLPWPGPSGVCQPCLPPGRNVLQAPDEHLPCGLHGRIIGALLARRVEIGEALAEAGDPGLARVLLEESFRVTIAQPCQARPQLAPLSREERGCVGPGGLGRVHPAPGCCCEPLGMRQPPTHVAPDRQGPQVRPHLGIPTHPFAAKAVGVGPQAPVRGVGAAVSHGGRVADACAVAGKRHTADMAPSLAAATGRRGALAAPGADGPGTGPGPRRMSRPQRWPAREA